MCLSRVGVKMADSTEKIADSTPEVEQKTDTVGEAVPESAPAVEEPKVEEALAKEPAAEATERK